MDHTDAQLIDDYCQGSNDALATLIRRHIDLVYASALRRTHDPGTADDVTQAVFIILAKKARGLRHCAAIAGWLILVTGHVSRAAMRAKMRRQHYEHAVAKGEVIDMNLQAECEQAEVARVLDDALAGLSTSDRDAIVLRYLETNSFVDVGKCLGISEEAARKRVDRGIGRLRSLLEGHSVFFETIALSEVIATFAAKSAPVDVVEAVARNQIGQTTASTISISNEVLRMFLFKKLSVAAAVIALMIGTIAGISVRGQNNAPTTAPAPSTHPAQSALAIPHMVIQLGVTNIEENVAFFEKVGFHWAVGDTQRPLTWATVESGVVRIRFRQTSSIPRVGENIIPYLWIDGGWPALNALHEDIASRDVTVSEITVKGPTQAQFDIVTPDGYVMRFFSMN